jgi:hypothetical protein
VGDTLPPRGRAKGQADMTNLTVTFLGCFTKMPKNEAHILYDTHLVLHIMAVELIKQNSGNYEELLHHAKISKLGIIHSLDSVCPSVFTKPKK